MTFWQIWLRQQDLYPRQSQVTTKVGRHGTRMNGPTGSVLALRLRATPSGTLKSLDPVGWLATSVYGLAVAWLSSPAGFLPGRPHHHQR
jgi:hypothetical protein